MRAPTSGNTAPYPTSLGEIAGLFLKLGTIAFGGPAAHIAMMEDEVVRRRGWLTRDEYLDYLGATNLIPGPNSTELAIHIGRARAGWRGLLVAGTSFIVPSALLTAGFGWAYVRYGTLPAAEGVLYGVKPVVIAVVLQALWGLGHTALKTTGLVVLVVGRAPARRAGLACVAGAAPGAAMIAGAAATAAAPVGLWPLFGVFTKIGAVLLGSGYVLLADHRCRARRCQCGLARADGGRELAARAIGAGGSDRDCPGRRQCRTVIQVPSEFRVARCGGSNRRGTGSRVA